MAHTLYLMRHGIAATGGPLLPDEERPLTADGARKVAKIALGLKRLRIEVDLIVSSPLRRAKDTADIVRAELGYDADVQEHAALAPGHAAAALANGLGKFRRSARILLVGHEPTLGQLASVLLTGSAQVAFAFKKGAVVAIDVSALPAHGGILKWFATPRQLRLISARHH